MSIRAFLLCASAVGGLFGATTSIAHLLPPNTATVHVVGTAAYVVVAAPVSAFAILDHVGTRVSQSALDAHRAGLVDEFKTRWRLSDGTTPGRVVFTWVLNPETDGVPSEGSSYLVFMERVEFDKVPADLKLTTTLFGRAPGEDSFILRATRGASARSANSQVTVVTQGRSEYTLFTTAWGTFTAFVRVGVEHILLGGDHLLFLLTIVTAAAGWRYWIGIISSFTLAHSITLSLAVFGVLRLAPALVEPAIAASIVFMAVLNFVGNAVTRRTRVGIVFACGLLHGLGFASALNDLGVDRGHIASTLLGFNCGIECGQLLFLSAVLLAFRALGAWLPPRVTAFGPKAASATAAGLGTVLFFDRVLPAIAVFR